VGASAREIAAKIGRHHSCVSQEIKNNGGRDLYSAAGAHQRAAELRARPKERKLQSNRRLHDAVNDGLKQKWSPRQISKRLEMEYPDDQEMRVSHETVYETLYLQARGELRTQLRLALRTGQCPCVK
jgi:transposase, IS30 family